MADGCPCSLYFAYTGSRAYFSPCGNFVASGSCTGHATMWDIAPSSHGTVSTSPSDSKNPSPWWLRHPYTMARHQRRQRHASTMQRLRRWSGKPHHGGEGRREQEEGGSVNMVWPSVLPMATMGTGEVGDVSWSSCGQYLATVCDDGMTRVFRQGWPQQPPTSPFASHDASTPPTPNSSTASAPSAAPTGSASSASATMTLDQSSAFHLTSDGMSGVQLCINDRPLPPPVHPGLPAP